MSETIIPIEKIGGGTRDITSNFHFDTSKFTEVHAYLYEVGNIKLVSFFGILDKTKYYRDGADNAYRIRQLFTQNLSAEERQYLPKYTLRIPGNNNLTFTGHPNQAYLTIPKADYIYSGYECLSDAGYAPDYNLDFSGFWICN